MLKDAQKENWPFYCLTVYVLLNKPITYSTLKGMITDTCVTSSSSLLKTSSTVNFFRFCWRSANGLCVEEPADTKPQPIVDSRLYPGTAPWWVTLNICLPINTHPFNGPLSVTTWVSLYQKGKTNLDFTEVRDSEWQWHRLHHMQVCTSLETDNQKLTMPAPHHSSFLQASCSSCRPTYSVNALKIHPSVPVLLFILPFPSF